MPFLDNKSDPSITVEQCKSEKGKWVTCPNLKYDENAGGFEKEVYKCEKCGRYESAYYDDMR